MCGMLPTTTLTSVQASQHACPQTPCPPHPWSSSPAGHCITAARACALCDLGLAARDTHVSGRGSGKGRVLCRWQRVPPGSVDQDGFPPPSRPLLPTCLPCKISPLSDTSLSSFSAPEAAAAEPAQQQRRPAFELAVEMRARPQSGCWACAGWQHLCLMSAG